MLRLMLNDELWSKLREIMLQHRIYDKPNRRKMALFAVNTGCRDQEGCQLSWAWEVKIPAMPNLVVLMMPSELVENRDECLVVCNDAACEAVESERGKHSIHVFTYKDKAMTRMNATAWRSARVRASLEHVRKVSFEDRQDLLGHRSGRITTIKQ
jgi:hypothetical protein